MLNNKLAGIRHIKLSLVLLCLLLISFSSILGCGNKAPASSKQDVQKSPGHEFPITIKDDLGRQVTLKTEPKRIVSVAPSHTEILFALGLGKRVVGVTTYCNYPKEALSCEKIGGFSSPSLEKIIALRPDLVLVTNDKQQNLIQGLDNAGVPVMAFSPASIDEIVKTIALIGQATGANDSASALNASIKKRTAAVVDKVQSVPNEKRLRVYYELWYEPLMSVGPNTLAGDLIEKAGGKSISADAQVDYPEFSEEVILNRNPQVMLNTYAHNNQDAPGLVQIKQRPGWAELSFVKTSRIYSLNSDLLDRSGPRAVDALELIAQTLYPDLFAKESAGK